MGENLEFTRNLREIYEKKTSEVDLGVVKDKGGGEQFPLSMLVLTPCNTSCYGGFRRARAMCIYSISAWLLLLKLMVNYIFIALSHRNTSELPHHVTNTPCNKYSIKACLNAANSGSNESITCFWGYHVLYKLCHGSPVNITH